MRRLISFVVIVCTFSAAAPLMAQDFGKNWIDRVTHELIEDEAQLSPHPVQWNFVGGVLYSYDNNIFLTDTDETSDSIITPFAGIGVKYAEPTFDAEADLLVNYNAYMSEDDINADEERFFGRIRYQGTKVTLSLAEVFRRETSPTDVVFTSRVSRFLSNTTPLIVVKATEVFAVELQSDLQLVNYLRSAFDIADNFNSRTLLTLAYTTGWNAVDLLVQGGYWSVTYQDSFAPPDADGFIGRVGVRGELSEKIRMVVLAGVTSAKSDDFVGTSDNVEMNTADIEAHLAINPSPNSTWFVDYSRRFGFSAGGVPFQVVDTAGFTGEHSFRDDLKGRARIDYSRVHAPGIPSRSYFGIGAGGEYKIHPHILLDASVYYRAGNVVGAGTQAGDFSDFILSLGVAAVF